MKSQNAALIVGVLFFSAAFENQAQAQRRWSGVGDVIGRGAVVAGRSVSNGFRAAKNALIACMAVDAGTGAATGNEAQRNGCMQTVTNQLRQVTESVAEIRQTGLDAWCTTANVTEAVRECNELKEVMNRPNAQRLIQAQRPSEFIQELRSRVQELQGRAQDAACRRQSSALRTCLLGVSEAFAAGEVAHPSPQQPQAPATQAPATAQR